MLIASMSRQDPQVLVAIVQMTLQMAAALKLDRAPLLAEVGIAEGDLTDRDGYLPLSKQLQLGHAIGRLRPDVNVGLAALEFVRPSTLGALGYVVSHCPTLREAVQAFMRYQNLLSNAVRWSVDMPAQGSEGSEASTRICIEAAPQIQALRFPLETQVGMWIVLGRQLAGVEWSPTRVQLRHHPSGDPAQFAQCFGCPVEFGAPDNALEIPAEVMALPVVGARPQLQPALVTLVQSLHGQHVATGTDMRGQVLALLLEALPRGLTTKDEAAQQLAVSVRTLTRRLGAQDTSFRDLLEQARQQLAQAWLGDANVAIHEVAYLLGYSDPSTFHRSFRRWTGQTPTSWRRAHRAQTSANATPLN